MLVVDRIEGEWAVIEAEGKTFNLPLALLPPGIREGDVISVAVQKDESATQKRKKEVEDLVESVFEE